MHKLFSLSAVLLLTLQGCSASYLHKTPYTFKSLPGWNSGDQIGALHALDKSCKVIVKQNPKSNAEARALIEENFTPYKLSETGKSPGHFTGYYQPTIEGSLIKTDKYTVPIYQRPKNLIRKKTAQGKKKYGMMENGKFVPFHSRQEIAEGNLIKKEHVIAWLPNRTERAFLQIQGSGRIFFPNGESILVGYSGQNGHPYRPIGRALLEQKELPRENINMQSIKKWLLEHPKKADKILNYDPSFVFFKVLSQNDPVGAQGIELTPKVSLAVDKRYTRYGTPIWIDTTYKDPDGKTEALQKLMVAQDTGGAIRGPNRGDVYWGHGKYAEYVAGHMNSKGKLWVLLPK